MRAGIRLSSRSCCSDGCRPSVSTASRGGGSRRRGAQQRRQASSATATTAPATAAAVTAAPQQEQQQKTTAPSAPSSSGSSDARWEPLQRRQQRALLGAMLDAHLADLAAVASAVSSSSSSSSSSSNETAAGAAEADAADETAAGAGAGDAAAAWLDALFQRLDGDVFFSRGGFVIPRGEAAAIDATGGSASYGEVDAGAAGVGVLLRCLAMDDSSVFVDLGCGRGRAALQVALTARVAGVVGLELSDSRLEQAELALQEVGGGGGNGGLSAAPPLLSPVEFRRADLSSCDLSCGGRGTHFYLCSTAFGAAICRSIAARLAASASFVALATSRRLPPQPHLVLLAEAPCAYSYNQDGRVFVYVRSPAAAPRVAARAWCRGGVCWLPGPRPGARPLGLVGAEEPLNAPPRTFVPLRGAAAAPGGGE